MLFSSLINKKLVNLDLKSCDKQSAVKEMVLPLKEFGYDDDVENIVNMVMEREKIAPTYLGEGIAIPHARIDGLKDFYIIIGRSAEGIDYKSEKGFKVNLIFLILSGKTKNKIMLQTLAAVAKLVKNKENREKILKAGDPAELIEFIENSGIKVKEALTNSDIMEPPLVFFNPEMTIKEAAIVFLKNNMMCAPVVDGDNMLIGEVRESDIVEIGLPKYMNHLSNLSFLKDFEPFEEFFKKEDIIRVKDIIRKDPQTVAPDTSIVEAAFLLVKKKTERIFVVNNGKLIGSITARDIITKVLQI
ncbi:MAG: PTS sugar transporter subunit IIA [bacterium]|nr:PTS sugar transporter subunit IIA [bacterium]